MDLVAALLVWVAVREEGVDGATLDQVLAPYWPVLWRLAAIGSGTTIGPFA
jgi:hypothetical protein